MSDNCALILTDAAKSRAFPARMPLVLFSRQLGADAHSMHSLDEPGHRLRRQQFQIACSASQCTRIPNACIGVTVLHSVAIFSCITV